MELRAYTDADAGATLTVFLRAIRETASGDYSREQIAVWADDRIDVMTWNATRSAAGTQVAVLDGVVVGFTDLGADGYIDMLFVRPDYGGQGVATRLLNATIARARERGIAELTTFASLTARPLFERLGFVVTEERHFRHHGVQTTNYAMRRQVVTSASAESQHREA